MFGHFVGFEVRFHKRKFWVRANTNFQMMPKVAVVYETKFLVLAFHENWAGTLLEKCKQCNIIIEALEISVPIIIRTF